MKMLMLAVTLVLTTMPGVTTAQEVNLHGYWTSPDDYVMGRVVGSVGQYVNISLGFLHGVLEGNHLLVLRRNGEQIQQVGWVAVKTVHRSRSICVAESNVAVQENDILLIKAEDLLIWDPVTRIDDEIIRRKVSSQDRNAYENTSRTVHGKDVLREIQAERDNKAEFWREQLLKAKAPKSRVKKPAKVKAPDAPKPPQEVVIELPAEHLWFIEETKQTINAGFNVIPSTNPNVRVVPGKTAILEMIATLWKQAG